jgi:hypothetical protein
MRRCLTAVITGLVVALVAAGVAAGDDGGRPFSTTLTGAQEAPGPGDPDATGQADLRLNQGQNEVCFDISWANVDGVVSAAHIHVAPAGSPGPVVVPLFIGQAFEGTDAVSGCTQNVEAGLIKAIRQDPSAYYVNVHSQVFPAGAVRSQLGE